MKFKTIFILFNAVIVFSFLVIYLMPLVMLGWDYTSVFWAKNWFLPVLFILVLGLLNAYFISNWKLFTLLEREDWDQIIVLLEDSIFNKKRYYNQHIRILVNSYLVRSDIESIQHLEGVLKEKNEKKIASHCIQFGIPYLLKNNPSEMEVYFNAYRNRAGGEDALWMDWNYSFALMLQKKNEEAKEILKKLNERVKEPVLNLLTVYLLEAFSSSDAAVKKLVIQSVLRLKGKYPASSWDREVERSKGNIEVVILSKLITEASSWMNTFSLSLN